MSAPATENPEQPGTATDQGPDPPGAESGDEAPVVYGPQNVYISARSRPYWTGREVVDGEKNDHKCPLCGVAFARKFNLKTHIQTHFPERPKIKCDLCHLTFYRNGDLARHRRVHFVGHKPHVCAACGKDFARLDRMRAHMESGKCPGGVKSEGATPVRAPAAPARGPRREVLSAPPVSPAPADPSPEPERIRRSSTWSTTSTRDDTPARGGPASAPALSIKIEEQPQYAHTLRAHDDDARSAPAASAWWAPALDAHEDARRRRSAPGPDAGYPESDVDRRGMSGEPDRRWSTAMTPTGAAASPYPAQPTASGAGSAADLAQELPQAGGYAGYAWWPPRLGGLQGPAWPNVAGPSPAPRPVPTADAARTDPLPTEKPAQDARDGPPAPGPAPPHDGDPRPAPLGFFRPDPRDYPYPPPPPAYPYAYPMGGYPPYPPPAWWGGRGAWGYRGPSAWPWPPLPAGYPPLGPPWGYGYPPTPPAWAAGRPGWEDAARYGKGAEGGHGPGLGDGAGGRQQGEAE